jgi:hypothetical protein
MSKLGILAGLVLVAAAFVAVPSVNAAPGVGPVFIPGTAGMCNTFGSPDGTCWVSVGTDQGIECDNNPVLPGCF